MDLVAQAKVGIVSGVWNHSNWPCSTSIFVLRQLKLKEPLLDLSAFKYPMFTLTTILLTIMMMTMFSTMTLLPFLFQGALGLTVYATGLIMLPGSLLNGLLSPVSGKLLINLVQERSLFLVRYY